jgi:hypothetical protein
MDEAHERAKALNNKYEIRNKNFGGHESKQLFARFDGINISSFLFLI